MVIVLQGETPAKKKKYRNSRLNKIWSDMKARCYDPKTQAYKFYGERGITVCEEWLDKEVVEYPSTKGWLSFKNWALTHGYADDLTIDRIDNNKGYSPDNCRWVSIKTQCNNTRHNRFITYNGRTQTMVQWSEEFGYETLVYRLHVAHWPVEKAFETPENADYRLIAYNGKTQSLAEWCRELNLAYDKCRLNRYHWTVEEAFTHRADARIIKRAVKRG